MNRLYKWLTIILALLLPWHGAITVFLPDFFRYWKEIVLFLFFSGFCWQYFFVDKQKLFPLKLNLKSALTYAVLFLFYGLILIIFSEDKVSSVMAFRYLGLGISVFLLFSLISRNFAGFKEEFTERFGNYFIYSSIVSVLFGIWVKFGHGAEFLKSFYSQTISSWVPGQTIPLWHEAGDFIRMQGASSGPIEFSHILLVALFLTLISKIKNSYKVLFSAIFLWGIYQSYSRAAILGAVIILLFFLFQKVSFNFLKKKYAAIGLILILFFAGFWGIKNTNILERAGTSAHFTRPVEATKFALNNFFSNNLGKLGPAARTKNLRENNNDQAMIAENVFIDIFAQMGIIGLIIYLLFFFYFFRNLNLKFCGFFIAALLAMNLATIFDMTPVSILFFIVFFLAGKTKISR